MKEKFALYNPELQEVLIGTPGAADEGDVQIERILTQLRERQIADEQVGAYERQRLAAQGLAQAEAIEKQVAASGGARYQLARQVADRFAESLEKSGVDVVPKVSINGAAGSSVLQALMTVILSDKLGLPVATNGEAVD